MEVIFNRKALTDLEYWKKSGDKRIQQKISILIEDIKNNPYTGLGKPEPFKHQLSGKWSRRIDLTHRIVYTIENNVLKIYSLKGHY